MLGDRERPSGYAGEQRRLLRLGVAAEVLAFAPAWRDAVSVAGVGKVRDLGDLAGLEPRPIEALGRPDGLVVRPSDEAVRRSGPRPLRRRLRRARLTFRGAKAARRLLDPLYKPVHWVLDGDLPVGSTEADLGRLAELGHRTLAMAGIGPDDAIVGLVPPGPNLPYWQLALGARQAGVPLAGLAPGAPADAVAILGPTVLAGRPADLRRVLGTLAGGARRALTTILVVGRAPLPAEEKLILQAAVGSQAVVVELWSPYGVRALWAQCRGGEGVHTWPQAELVEVVPSGPGAASAEDGQLVWTGLGWRGTALVRLATGVNARLVEGRCPTCGRTTPRVVGARLALRELPAGRPRHTTSAAPRRARRTGGDPTGAADGARAVAVADPAAGEAADEERWLEDGGDVDVWPAPVLASTEGLAGWQVEHRRRRGHDQLIVRFALDDEADLGEVLVNLERALGATQYLVLERGEVAAAIAAAGGHRVVDRRPSPRSSVGDDGVKGHRTGTGIARASGPGA